MTRVLSLVIACILGLGLLHAEDVPAPIQALLQKVDSACQSCDLAAIRPALPRGAETIDIALSSYQEYFKQSTDVTRWNYDKATYQSLDDLKRTVTNPNALASLASDKPQKMGEHLYEPNLKIIGFITVSFKSGHGASVGTTESVGMTSDGSARLILRKMLK